MARGKRAVETFAEPVDGLWELPEDWQWAKLGEVTEVNPKTDFSGLDTSAAVTFVPMAAVSEESGAIRLSETRAVSNVTTGFKRFKSGDVIFAKITPCMENGKIAVVPEVPGGVAAGSTEFHVVRSQLLRPQFVFLYLVRRALREEARRQGLREC